MAIDINRGRRDLALRRLRDSLTDAKATIAASFDRVIDAVDELAETGAPVGEPEGAGGPLLAIGAAAKRMGVSVAILDSLARRGEIATVEIPSARGSRPMRRFRPADIDGYRGDERRTA